MSLSAIDKRLSASKAKHAQPSDEFDKFLYHKLKHVLDNYPSCIPIARPHRQFVNYCWRNVAQHPYFVQRLSDVHTNVGRNITLTVRIGGLPNCEVRWFKDERPLTCRSFDNISMRYFGEEIFVLCIREARAHDGGLYSCTATNSAGTVRSTAFVAIDSHPVPFLKKRGRNTYESKTWNNPGAVFGVCVELKS